MNLILALVPIGIILLLMVGFHWSAVRAGAAGYLSTLLIAFLFFGAGPELLAYTHTRALLLTVDVLLIIWAAFLLYRVADEAGAIRTIGLSLPHLTTDKGMQALIIGWAFASFLQGVGGFGVPVAVIAPILVGLQFTPLAAVVIPSLGHGWAVTFGSLGSSFQALMAATGLPESVLAPESAVFLGISGLVAGSMVAHAASGWAAVRRLFGTVLLIGCTMGLAQYIVATHGLWNIAAFCGGLAGLVIALPLARRNHNVIETEKGKLSLRALMLALSGYVALIMIILLVQFIPAIKSLLGQWVIRIHFPEVQTTLGYVTSAGYGRNLSVFNHTGLILAYASVVAYLIYRRAGLYRPGASQRILNGMFRNVMPSSVSIASMVAMAVMMENSGMTDVLARGLAEGMGGLFTLVAPWIGALGSFMTGSNTNSNVLFGALQLRTAELLGYPAAVILAAQTAGAGLASVTAPTKVVVGASTAGMAGREGEVMGKMLLYTGVLLLLLGGMSIIAIWIQ
jgi:lactate permease